MSQYNISRKQFGSIALASICHVLEEVQHQAEEEHTEVCILTGKTIVYEKNTKTADFRNSFIKNLLQKFPNSLDLEETLTIVHNLNEQAIRVDTKYSEPKDEEDDSNDDCVTSRGFPVSSPSLPRSQASDSSVIELCQEDLAIRQSTSISSSKSDQKAESDLVSKEDDE